MLGFKDEQNNQAWGLVDAKAFAKAKSAVRLTVSLQNLGCHYCGAKLAKLLVLSQLCLHVQTPAQSLEPT